MFDIRKLFLLNGLDKNDSDAIISILDNPVFFKKNEIIFSGKNYIKALGFITQGTAFAISNNQNKVHLKTFEESMCFGAASLFGKKEGYVSTIIAKTDVQILFITEQQLKSMFEKYPETALNYIKFLSDKVRFLNTKISVISCTGAEDTLYKYLSLTADGENNVTLPISMTLLAKTLSLSRATLYRAFDTLELNGKILRKNNKIKVIKNEKNY